MHFKYFSSTLLRLEEGAGSVISVEFLRQIPDSESSIHFISTSAFGHREYKPTSSLSNSKVAFSVVIHCKIGLPWLQSGRFFCP